MAASRKLTIRFNQAFKRTVLTQGTVLLEIDLTLKARILLSSGSLLLACAGAGLFGLYNLNQSIDAYAKTISVDYAQERTASLMLVDFKTQVQEWKNVLLRGKDAMQLDKYWAAFQAHAGQVQASANRLAKSLPAGEARVLTEKFASAHAEMGVRYQAGFEAFKASGADPATGDAAVKGMDREPSELLLAVGSKIIEASSASVQRAEQGRDRANLQSLSLLLLVAVIGCVGAVMLARSIYCEIGAEPSAARAVATEISAGNLAVDIAFQKAHGQSLMAAMLTMRDSLALLVGQVRSGSDSMAIASTEIASGNADLSQRTEQQAGALQQATASMEQMGSAVNQNAEGALQAKQLAQRACEVAVQGGATVNEVVSTMLGINQSSKQIADIVGVIDGIAFQTNILALNAAVEAARAGEQGRGFAVVASEVRSLAQRSAGAAKEIKALISDSVRRVEQGNLQVARAGATMADVVAAIQGVSDIMGDISLASGNQSASVAQVGAAVMQIDRSTQQNAALVEQSASATEALRQQANRLVHAVGAFKLAPALGNGNGISLA